MINKFYFLLFILLVLPVNAYYQCRKLCALTVMDLNVVVIRGILKYPLEH